MNDEFWKEFPPIPGFDCIKMKSDIQAKIYEEIKDMTSAERVAYFNRAGAQFQQCKRHNSPSAEALLAMEDNAKYLKKRCGKKIR